MNSLHLVSAACILGAVYLISTGHDGWGWLMLLALPTL